MSQGKLPGFKGWLSGSQGKRRFKSDLSVDMISPPLADFRHTMHVGRGGDVFGDTSFLSSYGAREPGSPDSADDSRTTGFFTRTFRHARRGSALRPRMGSRDLSSPPPEVSPIIKNAVSLPQLNVEATNGRLERALFPSISSYGLQSGFVTLPRFSRFDRLYGGDVVVKASLPVGGAVQLSRSDSLTSFTVDLGPSLMTEVLSLIDNPGGLPSSNHSAAAGAEEEEEEEREEQQEEEEEEEQQEEEEEEDSSLTDTPVQTPAGSSPDSSFRRSVNSRGRAHIFNRTEQQEDTRSTRSPDAPPGSPLGAESGMEAERFQRAANVLSRHYGGASSCRKTPRTSSSSVVSTASISSSNSTASPPPTSKTTHNSSSCSFSEEEEEIKV